MVPSAIFSRRPISLFDNPSEIRRMIRSALRSVSVVQHVLRIRVSCSLRHDRIG